MTRLATPIFDNAHPKHFWSAFNFCDHVSTYKNSGYLLHLFILKIQPILESHHQSGQTHFWTCLFFTMTYCVWNCTSMQKNQLLRSVLSWDTVNFRVQGPDWLQSFLTMPTNNFSINFQFLWIYINIQKMRLFHRFALEKCLI